MKNKSIISSRCCGFLLAGLAAVMTASTLHADQTKANNNTALQSGGSWVSGTAPGAADNAIWNATVSSAADCTNTLGAAVTWKGIAITNPSAPVMINGSTTLTLNNGINLAAATKSLTLNCGTIGVATNQTWTVASGITLTTGSANNAGSVNSANNLVTLAGAGTWTISGTGDDNSLGVTVTGGTLNLNKTSSSGVHAIGGPGLIVNSGATAKITGSGGDQIYDGGGVTVNGTLDLNGNSEAVNGLNGSGTVTTTLSGGTPTLTVGATGTGGTFSGTIQSGTNGSITLTKAGAGTQSVACIIRGNGTAGPNLNANAGTLTLNGSVDNSWAAATVASGATLLLDKTSSSGVHAVGGGGLTVNSGGTVQLIGTGGDQIYDGANVAVSGTFDLDGNSETVAALSFTGGILQNSSVTTATLTASGNLTMSGNVTVNDPNAATGTTIILQYTGTRSGSGSFVAGSLPAGATVVDNASAQTVSVVNGGAPPATTTVGATTPFTSYEGEAGFLAGGASLVALTSPPTTEYSSPQLEASGHAYVQLTATGQSVTWTNNTGQSITALNLRSCIPDAPTGGGITSTLDLYVNGVFRQAFSVNSLQNYCYEGTNYNGQTDKNPADGDPRGFWNDTHAFIAGAAVAPGSTITFQKDSTNSANFYYIDVVDLEAPPAPLTQPANSLSILTYGAVSNSPSTDNTAAINNCFAAAQAQGKIAWIPPGTFYFSAINGGLNASGITIDGAGPWYSTLYRMTPAGNSQGVANIITTTSSTLQNVSLDCNASSRAGNINNGAVNFSGTNWLVNNVWIQHVTSSFWCAGVGGTAQNCRVLSVWSDGGNFNNVQSANGIGMNLTYSNNFVRGTGDDAMAINSVNYNGSTFYTIMSNITYVNNTAIAPWGGKCIGIYGGVNDVVTNNLLCDTARYLGLGVMRFGVNGSDLESARVVGNTLLRCGGNGYNQQQQAMMIGNGGDGQGVGTVANAYCASNTIINSLYDAVGFSTSTNIVFQRNIIINPGLDAIAVGPPDLGSGVMGNVIVNSNTVTGLNSGHLAFTNDASSYVAIFPTAAANYAAMSGVTAETCAEGGLDIGTINNGSYATYTNLSLNGINTFVARVASAGTGGNIQIYLDATNGTLIGTCPVPATGGWQTWTDTYCNLSAASGTHTLYLVFTGGAGNLFNVEFFGLYDAPSLPGPLVLESPENQPPAPLAIVSQPVIIQMQVNSAGQSLTLHWSGTADTTLTNIYQTADLTPPVTWTLVTNNPAYADGQWTVTLPIGTNTHGFYRLQQ